MPRFARRHARLAAPMLAFLLCGGSLLAATSASAAGSSGINLSWDDCGIHGTELKTFACDSNAGTFVLVASYSPPAVLPEFLGLSADLRIMTADALPDWWKHGVGQCRGSGTGLTTNFDFTGGPTSCTDVYLGQAAGGLAYDVGYETPNQARLRVQCAIPFDERRAVSPGTEYYAFKAHLLRTKTTGAGSCVGCEVPALVTLREIQLFQPPEQNNDPVLFEPMHRATVRWQGSPTPGPRIDLVAPTAGAPGQPVTITGESLDGATGVDFGGVPATFTIASDTEIATVVPAEARTGRVRVLSPGAQALSPTTFVVAPVVEVFQPTQSLPGTVITISGYNFTGATAVAFHGTPTTFTPYGDHVIYAPVPNGATDGPISVTNAGGTGASSTSFIVAAPPPPPQVSSFTPTAGAPGVAVTITGDHFDPANQVTFGGRTSIFSVVSSTRIDAVVPPDAFSGPIAVRSPWGTGTSDSIFIAPPGIESISPPQAPVGYPIDLHGYNFTRTLAVEVGGVPASFENFAFSVLKVVVPKGATGGPVVVTNAAGSTSHPFTVGPLPPHGINLSWDDCGTSGAANKSFTCATNTGTPFTMVGSFIPPPGILEFLGISVTLDVAAEGTELPDWWKHGSGTCRGTTNLSTSFDFTTGPAACADFFSGQAAGGFVYEIGVGGTNHARLRIQAAIPFDNRGPLDADTEYYAFKVNLQRGKSIGPTACADCDDPVDITLQSIQLFQPPELENDPVLIVPLDNTVIHWQSDVPSAVRIDSFTPTSGTGGTVVTISGHGFTGATSVRFGLLASTFTVESDSVVIATAPNGVTRGPIEVVAPLGTARSEDYFNDSPPAGAEGINLSWSDCGVAGSLLAGFACDSNTGTAQTLVASFGPPPGIEEFVGMSATINIKTPESSLPDWWRHGTGQCRGTTGMSVNADFDSGPYTCVDPWPPQAAGGFAYDVGFGSPDRARLRVQFVVPFEERRALPQGVEYYAFKVNLDRSRSTGAGACTGCSVPMCIVFEELQLFQPPEQNSDPIVFNPIHRNFVQWQEVIPSCPFSTPVLASVASVEASAGQVAIVWQTHDVERATVYRRSGSAAWRALATVSADGSRRIGYVDTDVTPGTYSYRLGVALESGEVFLGETEVVVPVSSTLALSGARASNGGLAISLSLGSAEPATIEVYDLVGRRWGTKRLEPTAAGPAEVELRGRQPLRGGVYFIRLTQGALRVSRRTVVVL